MGGAVENVNHTVKGTVDVVKVTAEDVNHTLKGTVDAVNVAAEDIKPSDNQVETQTAYILVPVDKEQVAK